ESKLEKLKTELKKIIEPEKDSIIFFKLREAYLTKKEIIGREKHDTSNII
ncbi:MAG TPA: CRISPR-associated endonuclease Cas2, partial [Clostridiales bacterium]|nr:CRISPR-associated endonuclease Cas2 [Clostridiales bacterium]